MTTTSSTTMHRHDQEDLRSCILTGVTLSNEVIVTIKNNIGDIKFIQNDFENAFLLYDEVYKIRSISRDSNAKGTSIAAFNVRKCLHCLGRSGAARRYYEIFTKSLFSSPNLNLLTNTRLFWLFKVSLGRSTKSIISSMQGHFISYLLDLLFTYLVKSIKS
jgi:hypothetical protein